MSDSVRPHRWQPSRLSRFWDSPGKNTGVGFHFLLQCMKMKSESEVSQSCPTLSDPMDCNLPGSSIHGIFQARVLSGLPFPYPRISHNYTYIMGRRRGKQRMRRLDGIINPMNMTEQTPGDSEGQRCLVCCHPWGHKESDTNETLNNNVHISTPS